MLLTGKIIIRCMEILVYFLSRDPENHLSKCNFILNFDF